jgi:hypothetical protein
MFFASVGTVGAPHVAFVSRPYRWTKGGAQASPFGEENPERRNSKQ